MGMRKISVKNRMSGLCGIVLAILLGTGIADAGAERTLLDADWLFHLGDISPSDQVITSGFGDGDWAHVDVPHDYVLRRNIQQDTRSLAWIFTATNWLVSEASCDSR